MKPFKFFYLIFLFVQITCLTAQTRNVCLNGEWKFMPDYNSLSPEQLIKNPVWDVKTYRVPSVWKSIGYESGDFKPFRLWDYPESWQKADAGLISRDIVIGPEPGKRIFLVFNGVLQRSEFYLDDKKVQESVEGFLPVEIEITDFIKRSGSYNLKVWTGNFREIHGSSGQMKLIVPSGSAFGNSCCGIWQDVLLEYRPVVFISNLQVITSVRNQEITVGCQLNGKFTSAKPLLVNVDILDGDKIVKSFSAELSAKDVSTGELSITQKWNDPVCWSPANPHLYKARVIISSGSKTIDSRTVRFGFREIWIDGYKLILNGKRINLRGDAAHFYSMGSQTREYARNWYRMCFDAGINFVRLHAMPYPSLFLEVADEMGMLIIDESAIYGSGKRMQADNPEFIGNCHTHLQNLVLRDRNHPSVIIWSMQNEMRWVDGRDGYREKIGELTATINKYDGTRPVSYDGDNRLVSYEKQQIENLHYNIDGALTSWKKEKPLIYGELGAWHYTSPQVASNIMGPASYLSYDSCMKNLGRDMESFIEYARKEDVTGLTPFNTVHYMNRSVPATDSTLLWSDSSTPGVKPDYVRKFGLEIKNGFMAVAKSYYPNPSFKYIEEGFKPVTIFPNEYDHSFYDNRQISRTFSVYNDTEEKVHARLEFQLRDAKGNMVAEKSYLFDQDPGERVEREFPFKSPRVQERRQLKLFASLYHGNQAVCSKSFEYSIYPSSLLTDHLKVPKSGVLIVTNAPYGKSILSGLLPDVIQVKQLTGGDLNGKRAIIFDENSLTDSLLSSLSTLSAFVKNGGHVLVLEQSGNMPGELSLSGKKFFKAFMNIPEHPALKDLSPGDLEFWGKENYHAGESEYMIRNAFNKPVQGNMSMILECAAGDWGLGGLLWTPMVEYHIDKGSILFNQIRLGKFHDSVPQSMILLRNMIDYTLNCKEESPKAKTGLISASDDFSKFFIDLNLDFERLTYPSGNYSLCIVDPAWLSENTVPGLTEFISKGGTVLIPSASPEQEKYLSDIVKTHIAIKPGITYQLNSSGKGPVREISVHDLYGFEKVTYSRGDVENTVLADYSVFSEAGSSFMSSVQNPWYEYFIKGKDGEHVKVGEATRLLRQEFTTRSYAKEFESGKGELVICEVKMISNNEKTGRVYSKLLVNLGAGINTQLLNSMKKEQDYGIPYFMYIKEEEHHDPVKMTAYFTQPQYVLNNLGEGVFGWMQPAEKKNGMITIPGSAGKTYFLTIFLESDINRDPSLRDNNELPNEKIIPDLSVDTNSDMNIFVNGKNYADIHMTNNLTEKVRIDDVLISKGINRIALIVRAGKDDIRFNVALRDKSGEFITSGITYKLTLD
jgi:beta-galactosidase